MLPTLCLRRERWAWLPIADAEREKVFKTADGTSFILTASHYSMSYTTALKILKL